MEKKEFGDANVSNSTSINLNVDTKMSGLARDNNKYIILDKLAKELYWMPLIKPNFGDKKNKIKISLLNLGDKDIKLGMSL